MEITKCTRCGRQCIPGKSLNPEARPFKGAMEGLCADCVVTSFLQSDEVLQQAIVKTKKAVLLLPFAQEQFFKLMKVGRSELSSDEINWEVVVDQWDLPFPGKF